MHNVVSIDLGYEGILLCEETYNGDFAGEFYDVEMILQAPDGREYQIGSAVFHDQNWSERIKTGRIKEWLIIPFDGGKFVQIKMINTITGILKDTTLQPTDLRKDVLYKKKYKDNPDHLYLGTSRVVSILGNTMEVIYEYKAKAEYPPEILVSQKVAYGINTLLGKLQTKNIDERVVQ